MTLYIETHRKVFQKKILKVSIYIVYMANSCGEKVQPQLEIESHTSDLQSYAGSNKCATDSCSIPPFVVKNTAHPFGMPIFMKTLCYPNFPDNSYFRMPISQMLHILQ